MRHAHVACTLGAQREVGTTSSGAAGIRPRLPAAFPGGRMWPSFVAGAICLYPYDRNNAQTVHLLPQKWNACYARLRQ